MAVRMREQIQECALAYEKMLTPPSEENILTIVEMLDIRGFQKVLPDKAEEKISDEWVDDLMEFPADLVELAYQRWRRSNVGRAPYASGELMESVKSEWIKRKSIYMKANSALKIIEENAE